MKCTYRGHDARLLLEAKPGDLFTPLGPHLVECVCAAQSIHADDGCCRLETDADMCPDGDIAVTVVACRMEPDEPEYYPSGFRMLLPAASPVTFVEQVEPLAMRTRGIELQHLQRRVSTHAHSHASSPLDHPELASRR